MAVTSSARSSAELFAETPRHLHDVRETYEAGRDGDRDGESFDDDAHDAGVPPKSPASPTRRGDRAAAAATALTRDTPLEEGVYVSEPHFAPPRMDESQARFHGDLRGGSREDRDPPPLFSQSLAVAPSPSSTRQSPPPGIGGFVPSPAERRAAALALERSRPAPDERIAEEEAGARERTEPEGTAADSPGKRSTASQPTAVIGDPSANAFSGVRERAEQAVAEEEGEDDAAKDLARKNIAARDETDRLERDARCDVGPQQVDAAFLAALMAEAEADAAEDARGEESFADDHSSASADAEAEDAARTRWATLVIIAILLCLALVYTLGLFLIVF